MKYRSTCWLMAVIFVLSTVMASDGAFGQSGRQRNQQPSQRDDIPTFTTMDSQTLAVQPASPPDARTEDVPPITWSRDFQAAVSSARPGQVVFVDVYTDWCSWCHYMDENVFGDPSVQMFSRDHVFVKVDAEDGGIGQSFARRTKVRAFPTLLAFSSSGKLLGKHEGAFKNGSQFIAWLSDRARRA